ncbi:hypothetical protein WN55_10995 [Dufourea novaeangliae]|uniref:Uncharacterized protein n=1 Tax=Dufourea novaeangliae TaxID=178035 RepID=A0A154PBJ4_DUFNO|nr:hypothetical protein WN55_10995 [Dufourea novaeangliae]
MVISMDERKEKNISLPHAFRYVSGEFASCIPSSIRSATRYIYQGNTPCPVWTPAGP